MFWIVQRNMWEEERLDEFLRLLKARNLPHVARKVVPFANVFAFEVDPDCGETPFEVPPGKVCVYGSTTLSNMAIERGWSPGAYINEHFEYARFLEECLLPLNYDAKIVPFDSIEAPDGPFFIRPADDSKMFAGTDVEPEKFKRWQDKVIAAGKDEYLGFVSDFPVVIASAKNISREYRYFIVGGKIAASCRYKADGHVRYVAGTPPEADEFVRSMLRFYEPASAFVMDVAQMAVGAWPVTERGEFSVIEINCINSAGLYACDLGQIIDAIEEMES